MNLLPKPNKINFKEGFLNSKKLRIVNQCNDSRIERALSCFGNSPDGVELTLKCANLDSEAYTLEISESTITITGDGASGVFYAIQTLRQIFECDKVPCLYIEDKPAMKYR